LAAGGTVTLIEKCSGAVGFEAVATEHRWVVHISGGSVGRGDHSGAPLPRPSWPPGSGAGGQPTLDGYRLVFWVAGGICVAALAA
jgi:hypothetical protein